MLGLVTTYTGKNHLLTLFHTMHKNKFQKEWSPKCEKQNVKTKKDNIDEFLLLAIMYHKQLENWTKYMNKIFSDIEQQVA